MKLTFFIFLLISQFGYSQEKMDILFMYDDTTCFCNDWNGLRPGILPGGKNTKYEYYIDEYKKIVLATLVKDDIYKVFVYRKGKLSCEECQIDSWEKESIEFIFTKEQFFENVYIDSFKPTILNQIAVKFQSCNCSY